MLVSVILVTRNSERYLDEVFKGILRQKTNAELEIILIDSGSTDRTLDIGRFYGARIYQIFPYEFDHGLTRNFGASKAKGEFLVFMTDDAIPAEDWLEPLLDNFADPLVAGAFSRHIPHPSNRPIAARALLEEYPAGRKEKRINFIENRADFLKDPQKYTFFSNTSSCIKKEIFNQIPFRKTWNSEDTLWAMDVLLKGYKTVFEPRSKVYHCHDFSILKAFRANVDHSFSISNIYNVKAQHKPHQILKYLWTKTQKDIKFMRKMKTPPKIFITEAIRSPFWHLATAFGLAVGRNAHKFPRWLIDAICMVPDNTGTRWKKLEILYEQK